MSDLILHEYAASGNCYKIRLTAAHVGIPLERRDYDILAGETRTATFLATVNPNGRIPVLQVGDDFLPESGAACLYLADGSPLIPTDRFDRADMLHWMFWEQYNHEPNVATLRFWRAFVGEDKLTDLQRAQIPGKRAAGEAALALMDAHLSRNAILRGRTVLRRRYRAVLLHPCCGARRVRAAPLSRRNRLAGARRGAAEPHPDVTIS